MCHIYGSNKQTLLLRLSLLWLLLLLLLLFSVVVSLWLQYLCRILEGKNYKHRYIFPTQTESNEARRRATVSSCVSPSPLTNVTQTNTNDDYRRGTSANEWPPVASMDFIASYFTPLSRTCVFAMIILRVYARTQLSTGARACVSASYRSGLSKGRRRAEHNTWRNDTAILLCLCVLSLLFFSSHRVYVYALSSFLNSNTFTHIQTQTQACLIVPPTRHVTILTGGRKKRTDRLLLPHSFVLGERASVRASARSGGGYFVIYDIAPVNVPLHSNGILCSRTLARPIHSTPHTAAAAVLMDTQTHDNDAVSLFIWCSRLYAGQPVRCL